MIRGLTRIIDGIWLGYQEDREWDFYLHKVSDGSSFDQFRKKLRSQKNLGMERPSDEDLRAIIRNARSIARGSI